MKKLKLLSLKEYALLCCYACFAMILSLSTKDFIYANLLLFIVSTIFILKIKNNFAFKMIFLSIIISSLIDIIVCIYNKNSVFTLEERVGNEEFVSIRYILPMLPIIYGFIKEKYIYNRIGLVLIGLALIPQILYIFTSPHRINIALSIVSISMIGFFVSSIFDSNNKTMRYIATLSGIGAFILMLQNIEDIIWFLCEKPEYSFYSWLYHDANKYPVFHFFSEHGKYFVWLHNIGYIFMSSYFLWIFKCSGYTLKSICIPAIAAYLLLILSQNGCLNLDEYFLYTPCLIITFILLAYSFYKFNKIL